MAQYHISCNDIAGPQPARPPQSNEPWAGGNSILALMREAEELQKQKAAAKGSDADKHHKKKDKKKKVRTSTFAAVAMHDPIVALFSPCMQMHVVGAWPMSPLLTAV